MLLGLKCNPEKQKFVLFFDYFVIITISDGEAFVSQFNQVTKLKVKTMREISSVIKIKMQSISVTMIIAMFSFTVKPLFSIKFKENRKNSGKTE